MKNTQAFFLDLLVFSLSSMIFAGELRRKSKGGASQERSTIEAREKEIGLEKKELLDEFKQREGKEKNQEESILEKSKNETLNNL